jgi:AcrR family transcriptional regulator
MAKKRHAARRERILEVTLDLFNRFGEPNVSTTLISAELASAPATCTTTTRPKTS